MEREDNTLMVDHNIKQYYNNYMKVNDTYRYTQYKKFALLLLYSHLLIIWSCVLYFISNLTPLNLVNILIDLVVKFNSNISKEIYVKTGAVYSLLFIVPVIQLVSNTEYNQLIFPNCFSISMFLGTIVFITKVGFLEIALDVFVNRYLFIGLMFASGFISILFVYNKKFNSLLGCLLDISISTILILLFPGDLPSKLMCICIKCVQSIIMFSDHSDSYLEFLTSLPISMIFAYSIALFRICLISGKYVLEKTDVVTDNDNNQYNAFSNVFKGVFGN
ncbi:hypothetical protein HERIO_1014 [Hepatospora eriocheir]|uniref:Uncharacterized protein n=1 Tax=Hepatospora eriocheir TaxID=1081669 RepID=A0A1X0QBI4_9MICR|nr:hypothetical protein HERIO_1014 [Hepatospora eriocheir]